MSEVPFPEEEESSLQLGSLPAGGLTKTMLSNKAKEVVDFIIDGGEKDALEQYIIAKAGIELLTDISKRLKTEAETELYKHDKSKAKIRGVGAEIASVPTTYSYDHDKIWNDISDKIKELTVKKKDREDLMKQAMKFSGVFDDQGVEVEAAKIKGGGGETIRISIPKT
jgi:hypothetical protein